MELTRGQRRLLAVIQEQHASLRLATLEAARAGDAAGVTRLSARANVLAYQARKLAGVTAARQAPPAGLFEGIENLARE